VFSISSLRFVTLFILLGAGLSGLSGLSGCRKGVDLDAGTPSPTPIVEQAASTPTPSSTIPAQPAASASPVKPGEVPEMMKRAFTKDEMDKAMQQLPPEIRDRLKGMSYAPSNIPAPKPAPAKTGKQ
jgi:hypothetical protein